MMSGRKSDASIAFSVTDNLSQSIVGMKNSVNSFRADVTGLQERLDAWIIPGYASKILT